MGWWTVLGAVALFALSCNLDTVLLAMGWAAAGICVSAGHSLIIAGVTTAVTWLSLTLGDTAGRLLPPGLTPVLGALALIGMGLWFVLDALRSLGRGEEVPPAARTAWGWVSLAAALAVNNAGIGVAAGVTGLDPGWAAAGNFAATLLALPLGRLLGRRLAGRLPPGWALPLSGVLLVVLGAWALLA